MVVLGFLADDDFDDFDTIMLILKERSISRGRSHAANIVTHNRNVCFMPSPRCDMGYFIICFSHDTHLISHCSVLTD